MGFNVYWLEANCWIASLKSRTILSDRRSFHINLKLNTTPFDMKNAAKKAKILLDIDEINS